MTCRVNSSVLVKVVDRVLAHEPCCNVNPSGSDANFCILYLCVDQHLHIWTQQTSEFPLELRKVPKFLCWSVCIAEEWAEGCGSD